MSFPLGLYLNFEHNLDESCFPDPIDYIWRQPLKHVP